MTSTVCPNAVGIRKNLGSDTMTCGSTLVRLLSCLLKAENWSSSAFWRSLCILSEIRVERGYRKTPYWVASLDMLKLLKRFVVEI